MRKPKIFFSSVLLGSLLLFSAKKEVFAAGSLTLQPATSTAAVDSTLQVKVNLDTGSDLTGSTDVVIHFPASLLQAQAVTDGGLYPTFTKNIDNTSGKIMATGAVSASDPSKSFQGTGTFATITFKAQAAGTASVTFDCTQGSTTDSNVVKKADSSDILNCNLVGNGSYTLTSGGGSPTSTPVPTPTTASGGTAKYRCSGTSCIRDDVAGTYSSSSCNNACSTSTLPQSGNETPTIIMLGLGSLLLVLSLKLAHAR